jgi:transcription antitermination factor NusG
MTAANPLAALSMAESAPAVRPAVGREAWFAVWTRSRHEATVAEQLRLKGLEGFLPTLPRWSRWKDRKKRIDWPLFPGYCFVKIDPQASLAVLKCTGVVSLVSFEGRPAPIPELEIHSVRTLVASDLQYDPCPLLNEGDRVEVTWGPLRGVVGRLVRKGSRTRLMLAVDLIGQGVSVEVDAADVRPY